MKKKLACLIMFFLLTQSIFAMHCEQNHGGDTRFSFDSVYIEWASGMADYYCVYIFNNHPMYISYYDRRVTKDKGPWQNISDHYIKLQCKSSNSQDCTFKYV